MCLFIHFVKYRRNIKKNMENTFIIAVIIVFIYYKSGNYIILSAYVLYVISHASKTIVYKSYQQKYFPSSKFVTTFVTLRVTNMNIRLKQFLAAENITQAQFADTLQIVRASVSHVLSGRNNPSYDFIKAIMEHYPLLNIEWLMLGTGKMYKGSSNEAAALPTSKVPDIAAETGQGLLFSEDPAEVSADKTDEEPYRDLTSTLVERIQTTVKQRKAIKVMILFDDGSYQEL